MAEEISSSSQQKFTSPHHFANVAEQPTTTPATAVTFDPHSQTSPSSPPPPQQQQQADTISPGVTFSDDQYEQYDSDLEPEVDLGVSRETLHEGQVLKAGYLHKKGERIKVNRNSVTEDNGPDWPGSVYKNLRTELDTMQRQRLTGGVQGGEYNTAWHDREKGTR